MKGKADCLQSRNSYDEQLFSGTEQAREPFVLSGSVVTHPDGIALGLGCFDVWPGDAPAGSMSAVIGKRKTREHLLSR